MRRSARLNILVRRVAERKKPDQESRAYVLKPGNFLLSHTLARAVTSGLRGLTSVFGMGTGGSLSLWSPRKREEVEERRSQERRILNSWLLRSSTSSFEY